MEAQTRSDSEIKRAVLDELAWDTRVDETEVGVEVDRGIVTLVGTVTNWGKRMAAQEAAHRVLGVLDVANDIVVRQPGTPGHTDTELAAAVRHALHWDVFVPAERIRSTVSHGWVRLDGTVDSWAEHEDAERVVKNLRGVIGVTNMIQVEPPEVHAGELRRRIQEALERRADREAQRLRISVNGDMVTLDGVVHSWAERVAVVGAVKGTAGVGAIADRLQVEVGADAGSAR